MIHTILQFRRATGCQLARAGRTIECDIGADAGEICEGAAAQCEAALNARWLY